MRRVMPLYGEARMGHQQFGVCNHLAPVIDRSRAGVVAAHDAPVAVGLAADDYDVDFVFPVDGAHSRNSA